MRNTVDIAQEIAAQYIKAERFQTWTHGYMMERLMELVSVSAATEREACAKVCDELSPPCGYNLTETSFWDVTSLECAAAIRARGNT